MARFITVFAVVLLAITVSGARFSDTKNTLPATTRTFTKKQLQKTLKSVRWVRFGSKAQIAAAKSHVIAVAKAGKAQRKHTNAAKKAFRQAKNYANQLARKAARKNAKPADKLAARQAAAALPRFAAAVRHTEAASARFARQLEHAKATLKKLNVKRTNKKVSISGQQLPAICYCARYAAGEGACYRSTSGGYCEARPCEAKHVCTTKAKSGGKVCFLRHVTSRIVSVRGRCRNVAANGYMFVPYWTHE